MPEYNIRFANKDDIPAIMQFIDEEWKKGHILSTDRELFDWQYVQDNKVNMVVGEDENHVLQGILGYIPYADTDEKDFSLALWKAKNGTAFLGVKLLDFLLKEESYRIAFCNGINLTTTTGIYKRFGFEVDKLKQWYRLCDREDYKIAKVAQKQIPDVSITSNLKLIKINTFTEMEAISSEKVFNTESVPYKSKEYVVNRYFEHPTYEYAVYGLQDKSAKIDTAVVVRSQECNGSKVLRIIDFIGDYDQIYHITKQLEKLADNYGAEYIDMYAYGLNDSLLLDAGWLLVGGDENIIPNYFSPYAECNVEINISTKNKDIVMFKGDGDQDRPN